MLVKQILFQQQFEECTVEEISPSTPLTKIATEVSPEIQRFIDENIKSDPRYVFLLLTALGAGEIWGPNVNGDFFHRDDILRSYKTFETFGFVYVHHKNKDPQKASGKVLLAHYNPRMHRVELIVQLDRSKAPNIAADADNGKLWDVSMGCKVKFDVCSICGNKAYTRAQYCTHLKHHMCEILPDGRQVYAINPNPRFFDISFVWVGADRTAKVLAKVASEEGIQKESDIIKEIPGTILSPKATHMASLLMEELGLMKEKETPLPESLLERTRSFPLSDVLTTLIVLGILLDQEEFLNVLKHRTTVPNAKDFRPFDGEVDSKLVKMFIPYLEERSALRPYLLPRMVKLSEEKTKRRKRNLANRRLTIPAAIALHTLYGTYLDHLPDFNAKGLDAVFKKYPALLPLVTAGTVGLTWGMGARDGTNREDARPQTMEKVAGNLGGRIFVGIPAAYLLSNVAKRWEDESKLARFLARNPALVAMLGISATNTADDWKVLAKVFSSFDKTNRADFGYGFGKYASAVLQPSKSIADLYAEYDLFCKQASDCNVYTVEDVWQEPGAAAIAAMAILNSKEVPK